MGHFDGLHGPLTTEKLAVLKVNPKARSMTVKDYRSVALLFQFFKLEAAFFSKSVLSIKWDHQTKTTTTFLMKEQWREYVSVRSLKSLETRNKNASSHSMSCTELF